jgi:hypothetical protein
MDTKWMLHLFVLNPPPNGHGFIMSKCHSKKPTTTVHIAQHNNLEKIKIMLAKIIWNSPKKLSINLESNSGNFHMPKHLRNLHIPRLLVFYSSQKKNLNKAYSKLDLFLPTYIAQDWRFCINLIALYSYHILGSNSSL